MKKRTIALLLTALILVSCSGSETPADETQPSNGDVETDVPETETETEESTTDDVPEMKFDGDINILMPDISWASKNIIADEVNGERVNDAQNAMKLEMEERFGTSLSETYTTDYWSTSYVNNLVTADDDSFDICFVLDMYALGYVGGGMVIPYDDIEYINLDKPYWDDSLNRCVTIGGVSYFAFGAYDLSYYDLTHILTFNKNLLDNYQLENPYELVKGGKWTFDKLYELAQKATDEVDGDNLMTDADSYGFVSVPKQVLPNFWISAGEQCIAKDENDLPHLNISGNERFYSVFEKLFGMMWDGGIWCANTEDQNFWSGTTQMFSDDRALFAAQTFYYLNEFRDIESDFGIIPYPKFDESQADYYSRVEGGCKIAIVPVTNKNPKNAGALLESMASFGYNNIVPEYYEVALKRRNSRDSESQDMLDLIFASRRYDLADTWWCNELRDGMFKPMFTNNNRDLASEFAKKEKFVTKAIQRAVSAFVEQ